MVLASPLPASPVLTSMVHLAVTRRSPPYHHECGHLMPPHPHGCRTGECPLMKQHPEVWSAHPVVFAWAHLKVPILFSIQDIMVEGPSFLSLSCGSCLNYTLVLPSPSLHLFEIPQVSAPSEFFMCQVAFVMSVHLKLPSTFGETPPTISRSQSKSS